MSTSSEAEMPFPPLASTATNPRGHEPTGTLHRARRISACHPEWWMLLATAAAWAFLAARAHASAPDGTRGQTAALAAMVVAMMLPLTIGRVREVARSQSPPRHRAAAAFVAGYLAVWMIAMFVIDAAWKLVVPATGWGVASGVVIGAAVLWEVAPASWKGSRRCDGAAASAREAVGAGAAWSGVTAGSGCVASCWALMAACVAVGHTLPIMAAFFGIQLYGRYRRPASPALVALAVLIVCAAALALTMDAHHHHPAS